MLWVRSWEIQSGAVSWYGDEWKYEISGKRIFKVFSNRGAIRLSTSSMVAGWAIRVLEEENALLGFGAIKDRTSRYAQMPHWFLVSMTLFAAVVPWLPWSRRFSLRTLLIATTLVAAVLGLVVWLNHH